MFLRSLWRSLRSSSPSRRPSLCLPKIVRFWCAKLRSIHFFLSLGQKEETSARRPGFPQGKEKDININKCAGLSWDWVGGKKLFMSFFRFIPYGGEKHINKIPPKIPGQSHGILFMCFFLCLVFSRSHERLKS